MDQETASLRTSSKCFQPSYRFSMAIKQILVSPSTKVCKMEHVCRWDILFCTDPSRSVAPASECEPSKQTSSQLSCLKASSWPACSLSMSSWHCQLCWKLDASCKVGACWRSCWMVSSSWYLVQELGIDWRPSSGSCSLANSLANLTTSRLRRLFLACQSCRLLQLVHRLLVFQGRQSCRY